MKGGKAGDLVLPIGFFSEGQVGGVGERLGERGVPFAAQLREKLVADAVPGEIKGRVGGIFSPGDGAVGEEANDLGALDIDKRADDAVGCDGSYRGQPGGAAAAEEAKEHGFRL